ncbi:MAG: class I SAM-dependent methyltransferase [Candidatus Omnitrophota bacterium]|jgi:SAM-dependent methyltransferase
MKKSESLFDNWLWAQPVFDNFMPELSKEKGRSILDLGCGRGRISAFFVSYGMNVVGLDINSYEEMRKHESQDLKFVIGSAGEMPFQQHSFDLIFSCSAMQYLDHELVFNELARVIKMGGYVYLHENMPNNPIVLFYRWLRKKKAMFDPSTQKYIDTIKQYISPAFPFDRYGFKILSIKNYYLFSPLLLFFHREKLRSALIGRIFQKLLMGLDNLLLKRLCFLRKFCWFTSYCLKKEDPR